VHVVCREGRFKEARVLQNTCEINTFTILLLLEGTIKEILMVV